MKHNKILVDNGEKAELVKLLETSYPTVRESLNGKVTTKLHAQIRTLAIDRGGVEIIDKIQNT